jgi:hypothetical protein
VLRLPEDRLFINRNSVTRNNAAKTAVSIPKTISIVGSVVDDVLVNVLVIVTGGGVSVKVAKFV